MCFVDVNVFTNLCKVADDSVSVHLRGRIFALLLLEFKWAQLLRLIWKCCRRERDELTGGVFSNEYQGLQP